MMVRETRRRTGGLAICLSLLLAAGLLGCNGPIETMRAATGMDKNDPDPATAPYTVNLDKAETGGYPNLASVPPPPEIASTTAERAKISANLTGERAATVAADARGQPGSPKSGPVPPPPPITAAIAAVPEAVPAPPTPKPETPIPPMRKADEPPVPAPVETPMQTPQTGKLPGVEPARPAPAQGQPAAMPRPASSALPAAAVQSGNPQPAPPTAALPVPQVEPKVAALPPPKLPPQPTVVAVLDTPAGSADRALLAPVLAQYQANPRLVRVVAYATPGVGAAEQLNAFRVALERAQAIAKQLSDAGIPVAKIQSQAAPAGPAAPSGRVEVQLLQ
jgi:hypothetical protein